MKWLPHRGRLSIAFLLGALSSLQILQVSSQCVGAEQGGSTGPLSGSCTFRNDGSFTVPVGISVFSMTCASGQGAGTGGQSLIGGLGSSVTLQFTGVTAGLKLDFAIGGAGVNRAFGLSSYARGGRGGFGDDTDGFGGGGATAAFINANGTPFLVLGGGEATGTGQNHD